MRRLGELEAEIMDRLWRWNRPATVREIVDDINEQRPLAYTTVMTVTNILFHKGGCCAASRGELGCTRQYAAARHTRQL
jgi:predicted transcriptional regulator